MSGATTLSDGTGELRYVQHENVPCWGGHRFMVQISTDQAVDGIPEGIPCECGKTIAHYENCPTCGTQTMRAIPVAEVGEIVWDTANWHTVKAEVGEKEAER